MEKFNSFGLSRKNSYNPEIVTPINIVPSPVLIEGAVEFDTLCPVSKFTGHRGNPLQLLGVALGDKSSRLLDAILQEIPVIQADDRISDEDKLSTLVSRLDTGTLAEQDEVTRVLSDFVDTLFPKEVADDVKNDSSIQFDKNDSPDVSAE